MFFALNVFYSFTFNVVLHLWCKLWLLRSRAVALSSQSSTCRTCTLDVNSPGFTAVETYCPPASIRTTLS